ncbi:unnamed protein product [Rhizoctonia solani]|uniref:Protein kinase domain-containing protein n=1 Tax=Rhizoctonia solani TaxID=456999 RepID=A0A8H3AA08_9AGAM|nr:unnamed protein product [Rhizoctonia solani]
MRGFHNALLKGEHPSEWKTAFEIPSDKAGDTCWDILCKCLSLNPDDRPTASEVSAVMRMVCQLSEAMARRSLRLVVGEDTSIHDLVAHFKRRGLVNYTDLVNSVNRTAVESVADTALANVYRFELRNNQAVAVKCVKHNTTYKRLKRAARELDCWSSHRHENILPILGFATIGADLAMVSPWMANGCITDYVVRNPNCNRLALCVQLAGVVAYLHENNAVHGDIKGPNVLVSDAGTVQVTDFGVSITDHQEIEFSMTSSGRGTQRWQAPEVLTAQTDSTREADVYALAMTMIEIYTGEPPYGSTNWAQIMIPVINNRLRPPRPIRLPIDEVGNGVWDLMQHCWLADPTERLPSNRVHEWLRYYNSFWAHVQAYRW